MGSAHEGWKTVGMSESARVLANARTAFGRNDWPDEGTVSGA